MKALRMPNDHHWIGPLIFEVPLLMVALLLWGAIACNASRRHQVVLIDTGIYSALAAIDDGERILFQAGQITKEQHRAFSVELVKLLRAGQALNTTIRQWPKGRPAPPELTVVASSLRALTQRVIETLPPGLAKSTLLTKVLQAEDAIIQILLYMGGSA